MQTKRLTNKPTHEVLAAIDALDLTSVKARLTDAELGEGWTDEYADSVEAAYKTYLKMLAKHQEHAEEIMLAKDVDEFWHTHILQTMKYMDDCQRVFGTYLHHDPHVGARTEADHAKRATKAERTRRLYELEFGSAAAAQNAWAGERQGAAAAYSNASIKPVTAAYSNATISGQGAAYSNASVSERAAAYSNAAVSAERAAYSNATIVAERAAYSNATIAPERAAYSNATIVPERAAYSNATIAPERAAYSNAGIAAEHAAYSNAAIHVPAAAYSNASVRA